MMSLIEKRKASMASLRELAKSVDPDLVRVAWTGGKDSTVVLALWREVLLDLFGPDHPVRAVNIDTGVKFPEIVSFRDKIADLWNLDLEIVRPAVENCIDGGDYPRDNDSVACCRVLKVEPLLRYLEVSSGAVLLAGIRRDENPSRSRMSSWESFETPEHRRHYPILEWSEMDVWSHIMDNRLPYCDLYDLGYRSLGCVPCTVSPDIVFNDSERAGRNVEKEMGMDALRSMGYF